ncbi:LRRN4 C-terminal-like protein [Elgaria multicarinata webbii]|uniref:LRRN4 C-terminal-like protein n=1 Tax=Elgaria multicarinata webbii TaxID=159646 RepID=UPI002FCCDDB4
MQIPALFLMAAWILRLCPPGLSTSMGHPLPVPLRENHLFPRPSGSNTPAVHKERLSPPTTAHPFQDYPDDYDYDNTVKPQTPRPARPPLRPCAYNHCQHLQVPCVELSYATGCSCPGVTGPNVAPEPPRLENVLVSETGASLHWCAPSSTVQEYRLQYRPVDGAFASGPALNNTFRLTAVSGLSPNREYLFCIVASNQAGASRTDDGEKEHGPCRIVRTPARQMPYAYVAAGLASALVLVVVSALSWHFFCRRKKRVPRGSLDNILEGEPGLGGAANSSFRSEEQL